MRGSGTVVTGTVLAGAARTDDRLVLADTAAAVRVRGVRVQNQDAEAATPGDRAAINLAGVSAEEVTRGDWLLPAESREPTTHICIELALLADFPRALKHNHPVHVYHASSHAQARILLIDEAPAPGGAATRVDVATSTPVHVKVGDRIVLRDHDLARTLGGGRVVALGDPHGRRRAPARLRLLGTVQPDDVAASAQAAIRLAPLHAATFARQWNLAPETPDGSVRRCHRRRRDRRPLARQERPRRRRSQPARSPDPPPRATPRQRRAHRSPALCRRSCRSHSAAPGSRAPGRHRRRARGRRRLRARLPPGRHPKQRQAPVRPSGAAPWTPSSRRASATSPSA